MKNIVLLLLLLAPLAPALAGTPRTVDVLAGIADRTIGLTSKTSGGLNEPLQCTVQNHTSRPITVRLPAGLRFVPGSDPGLQNLMTVQEVLLVLAPYTKKTIKLNGFCMEKHDRGPSTDQRYVLKDLADPDPKALADSLQKYPGLVPICAQAMLWTLTDAEPLRELEVEPGLLRAARNVMRFVSERAHLPAAAVRAGAAPRRTPRWRTFSKTGSLLYHSPMAQVVTLKVYETDGSERYALFQNKTLKPGVVQYSFGLNETVDSDGPPPVYFFRLLDAKGKVLKETRVDDATQFVNAEPLRQKFTMACTLAKPVSNAVLRVRLTDGTLVEEVMTMPRIAMGKVNISSSFNHIFPPGTAFVAQLESATGEVYAAQPIAQ